MIRMAAKASENKVLNDTIFAASGAATKAIAKYGAEAVTNATLGAIFTEDEKLACLPAVEKVYRSMPMADICAYAPISGLPDYLRGAANLVFADHRPEGYIDACVSPGGTGAVHLAIENYAEWGDTVLTSDWFWGPYKVLCENVGRNLETYELFDESLQFNIASFEAKARALLKTQESLLIIINTPAHNPTGYSLSDEDWDGVLAVVKDVTKSGEKRVTVLVDIAYIDYAGEKNETHAFMEKFGGLPENIFTLFAFSMSKGYTLYGQRCGALVGLSSSKEVIGEFARISKYSSRAAWSNCNRAAMTTLIHIDRDQTLLAELESERDALYQIIRKRGEIFMQEAEKIGLVALPYKAGFFISVPAEDPAAVCNKLQEDNVFAVPLKKGVRIAICGIASRKVEGLAAKVKKAWDAV
ncbi:aminotransferase class I/II-fold pyridoxal phosphate-dependent enzyme [Selenomonas sp. TAMA-11512]|uniref:pyridoxal phosphate-dependent aminotransferase n=1 Tax=Selenomonas sp. TAMA-11512 TaxID=3095337 RepID=UPI00308DA2B8|nr:aminotransferase class I/II-fold pyridoxal phosphate-dependent enzyme [Selenomonas sp. TAMA-11512]